MQKNTYQSWKRFVHKLQNSKNAIDQLSKLYIIIHEQVRMTIRKSSMDSNFNVTVKVYEHLNFIKDILLRLNDSQQDEYLVLLDQDIIKKFQINLFDLIEQLQAILKMQISKNNLNNINLLRINPKKNKQKKGIDLKMEIEKSRQRLVRSKSGHRITNINIKHQQQCKDQEISLIPMNNLLKDLKAYKKKFMIKQKALQNQINTHVNRKGNQIYFDKKYQNTNLEKYLQHRKEISNLMFCQEAYDNILTQNDYMKQTEQQSKETLAALKMQSIQSKLFPQFNIKTKYMKEAVKNNIIKTIIDVKKQLLKQHHETNICKFMKGINKQQIELQSNCNQKNQIYHQEINNKISYKTNYKISSQYVSKNNRPQTYTTTTIKLPQQYSYRTISTRFKPEPKKKWKQIICNKTLQSVLKSKQILKNRKKIESQISRRIQSCKIKI